MPPPLLTANAPVLNIPHPGIVSILGVLWNELDRAILDCLDGGVCQRLNPDIPLVAQIWLYHDT